MAGKWEDVIQRAGQLLREGRKLEARSLLTEYLQRYPNSAPGWWFLSFAVTDQRQEIDCLERVLRLDRNYAPARLRLAKLKEGLASGSIAAPSAPDPSKQAAASASSHVHSDPAASTPPRPMSRAASTRRSSKPMDWILLVGLFLILLCVAVAGFSFLVLMRLPSQAAPLLAAQPTENRMVYAARTLPPTWTATITQTPFPTATFIPAYTPALSTPNPLIKPTGPMTGLFAPDFLLNDVVSGNQVRLSNYNGRPVLILFMATWCPHCAHEISSVQSVYADYKGNGLAVLAVDVGENATKARNYRSSHGLTFTVLDDSRQTVSAQYRISGFPTHFFIDSTGRILSIVIGEINSAGLTSKVKLILPLVR